MGDVLTSSFVYPEGALPSWSALVQVSCDSCVLSLHRLLARKCLSSDCAVILTHLTEAILGAVLQKLLKNS